MNQNFIYILGIVLVFRVSAYALPISPSIEELDVPADGPVIIVIGPTENKAELHLDDSTEQQDEGDVQVLEEAVAADQPEDFVENPPQVVSDVPNSKDVEKKPPAPSKPAKPAGKPQKPGGKPPQKPAGKPQKPSGKPQKPSGKPQKPGVGRPQRPPGKPERPSGKPQKPGKPSILGSELEEVEEEIATTEYPEDYEYDVSTQESDIETVTSPPDVAVPSPPVAFVAAASEVVATAPQKH